MAVDGDCFISLGCLEQSYNKKNGIRALEVQVQFMELKISSDLVFARIHPPCPCLLNFV